MKLGVSTYSLFQALKSGEMDIMGVIDWIADQGGEHVEIVPLGFDLPGNLELADEIRLKEPVQKALNSIKKTKTHLSEKW